MSNISQATAIQYAQSAGFSGSGLDTIVAIARCESGLNPNATNTVGNTPNGSMDRGILQFNSYWHSDVNDSCAFNPQCAFQQAFRVSQGGTNFSQWSTYQNGCYKQYLNPSLQGTSAYSTTTPSSLPFGLDALRQAFTNAAQETGIFLIALVIIILGVFLLMHKVGGANAYSTA